MRVWLTSSALALLSADRSLHASFRVTRLCRWAEAVRCVWPGRRTPPTRSAGHTPPGNRSRTSLRSRGRKSWLDRKCPVAQPEHLERRALLAGDSFADVDGTFAANWPEAAFVEMYRPSVEAYPGSADSYRCEPMPIVSIDAAAWSGFAACDPESAPSPEPWMPEPYPADEPSDDADDQMAEWRRSLPVPTESIDAGAWSDFETFDPAPAPTPDPWMTDPWRMESPPADEPMYPDGPPAGIAVDGDAGRTWNDMSDARAVPTLSLTDLTPAPPTLIVSGRTPSAPWDPAPVWTPQDQDAAAYASLVYEFDGIGFHRLGVNFEPAEGLQASLFQAQDGTYYLAFQGTRFFTLEDWLANVVNAAGFPSGQYEQAITVTRQVQRALPPDAELILTGHSLGGGLATTAALLTGLDAITFNASTANWYYQRDGAPGSIRSHVVIGDPLSVARTLLPWLPLIQYRGLLGDVIPHAPRSLNTHGMTNFGSLWYPLPELSVPE